MATDVKTKQKRKIKMPNAFITLFIVIVAVAVLTWVVPAGTYDYVDPDAAQPQPIPGTYQLTEKNPQGIWEVLMAPI